LVRKIIFIIANVFMRLTTRIELLGGLENIPPRGGALVVINHLGRLDAVAVYIFIKRNDLTGWVADKYRHVPLLGFIVRGLDGVWLNREGADRKALRWAIDRLREGWILGIAPEGTRSPTGALIEGKEGVAFLAAKTGVVIIPAGVTGTEKVWNTWKKLKRPKLTVRFGKPFHLPKYTKENREQILHQGTDEIMCRLAALLPEKYHGEYSQHPRVLELLQSSAQ
jgi:1-acyl-sn-glycerol-3-phosphate acyltransferase